MERKEDNVDDSDESKVNDEKDAILGLLINWDPQIVSLFVQQINLLSKISFDEKKPEIPIWIKMNEEKMISDILLMISIVEYLRSAGSNKSFGWSFVGPNTMVQYIKKLSEH